MISKEDIKALQAMRLQALVNWCGSKSQLARNLGVSRQVVGGWVKRGRIAATYATMVERKTRGEFKREHLRPDVITWVEKV